MFVINLRGKRKYKFIAILLGIALILGLVVIPLIHNSNYLISQATSSVRLVPIYSVDRHDKVVAISFDASWGAERTPKLLNIMDKYNIKTTFFLVNIWLKDYPEMAKTIVERGHEIGLHSTTHPHFSSLSEAEIKKELLDNYQMIKDVTGYKAKLFRPPFGDYNNTALRTVANLGFTAIQWSVDSLDWKDLSASDIEQRVLSRIEPGDIVLFHNNGTNTPEAVDHIIADLKKDGYKIVPVSQLLLKDNTYIDFNGIQRQDD